MFSISDRSENLDISFDFGSETDDSDIVDFGQPSEQVATSPGSHDDLISTTKGGTEAIGR